MPSPYIPLVYPGAPQPMPAMDFGMPNMGSMPMGSGSFDPQGVGAGVAPTMFSQPGAVAPWQASMPAIATPTPGGAGGGGMFAGMADWLPKGFLDSYDANGLKIGQGWGGAAFGAAGGLASAYLGMKQYGMAKETLAANKDQFNRRFEAQRTTTNSQLEDRQRARVASNAGAYESVGSYMDRNAVR